MTVTLDLPKQLERELSAEAAQLGLSLAAYVVLLLERRHIRASTPKKAQNGAELVSYWERAGVIGSRSDIEDAPAHAQMLRDQAERRPRS